MTDEEHEINILRRKLTAAEEMLESLKCCGNCGHYHPVYYDEQCLSDWADWHEYCYNWQWDGLTAEQRRGEKVQE